MSRAKALGRCQLAQLLQELDGYRGYSLADWLCMAFYESNFDTAAKSVNADGSTSFGIFQINNRLWCTDERSPSENLCRVACTDLLTSDITDDIICAKKIVRHPQGMDACTCFPDGACLPFVTQRQHSLAKEEESQLRGLANE
uniref:lysozyme n=1 Tax=Nothoprocta perdicaria TaxID=30464 RepID=A0A8C6Z3L0_NOTPE